VRAECFQLAPPPAAGAAGLAVTKVCSGYLRVVRTKPYEATAARAIRMIVNATQAICATSSFCHAAPPRR
jgi:hypothetical protein